MDRDDYYYDDPEETKSRPTRQKVMAALAGFVLIFAGGSYLSSQTTTKQSLEYIRPIRAF
jgi:hypothetical protein